MSVFRIICSFICLLQMNGIVTIHDDHNMVVVDTIPRAECINEVLE